MKARRIIVALVLVFAMFGTFASQSFACGNDYPPERKYTGCCKKGCVKTTDYKVRYLEVDTEKVLAPEKNVKGLAVGTEITEKAIDIKGYTVVGSDIRKITLKGDTASTTWRYYKGYWFKKGRCWTKYICPKTMKCQKEKTCNKNVITFYYKKNVTTTSYVVRYLDENYNVLFPEKIVDVVEMGAEITETAVDIKGHVPKEPTEKTQVMQEEGNIFEFIYRNSDDL